MHLPRWLQPTTLTAQSHQPTHSPSCDSWHSLIFPFHWYFIATQTTQEMESTNIQKLVPMQNVRDTTEAAGAALGTGHKGVIDCHMTQTCGGRGHLGRIRYPKDAQDQDRVMKWPSEQLYTARPQDQHQTAYPMVAQTLPSQEVSRQLAMSSRAIAIELFTAALVFKVEVYPEKSWSCG